MPGISVNKIAIPFKGGGMSWSSYWTTQYQAVYDAMINKPVYADKINQARFVKTLVDNGIFTKAEGLIVLAAPTEVDALLYWNDPSKSASKINTPTFTKYLGYAGVGASTSLLTTNFDPATDAVKLTRTSNSFGFYSSSLHPNSVTVMGSHYLGHLQITTAGQTDVSIRNFNTALESVAPIKHYGSIISNRSAENATQSYWNGNKILDAANAADAAATTGDIYVLGLNLNNGTPNGITSGNVGIVWWGASLTAGEALILSNAMQTLIEGYFIKKVITSVPDKLGDENAANTGITINPSLEEIYVVAAVDFGDNRVYVYDYSLNFKRIITPPTGVILNQSIEWDSIRNVFINWAGTVTQKMYVWSESALIKSYTFDPYVGARVSGSLSHNMVDDCLYVLGSGANVLKRYTYNGATSEWDYDADISVPLADEGVAYDRNTDTIWYNQSNGFIANIQKDGTVIQTYRKPMAMVEENEGMVYCPARGTIYVNADTYYHGSVVGGNRTWELDFGVYN